MRLRNVPGARDVMEENPYVYTEPKGFKGRWKAEFGNDHPLYIEIGMGKGRFITENARLHPDINYIGIEKFSSVLLRGVQKQNELELPNLKFIRMDAEEIEEVFDSHEDSFFQFHFLVIPLNTF